MPLVVTEAIVLHAFDYLETSRIVRLLTRDAGIQSALARGARRPKSRFGTGLDLFNEGTVQYVAKPGRELHSLTGFDLRRSRPALAGDLARFTGAATLAELALRFGHDDPHPELYEIVAGGFEELASPRHEPRERTLASAWRMVTSLGFTPELESCASCHAEVPLSTAATFSPRAGGVLCARCSGGAVAGRMLPARARHTLMAWHEGKEVELTDDLEARAHQRLLREFVGEHLSDGKALRAFDLWEREGQDPYRLP